MLRKEVFCPLDQVVEGRNLADGQVRRCDVPTLLSLFMRDRPFLATPAEPVEVLAHEGDDIGHAGREAK